MKSFFLIVLFLIYSCQEIPILDNTKIRINGNATTFSYNGWNKNQCIKGKSAIYEDYYRIVFGISPMIEYHLKENYIYEYATKKCYDVSTSFTFCDFYISFEWDIEYYQEKKTFYKLPKKYLKLIDSFSSLGNQIYFVSKHKQQQIGLGVVFMTKKEWDELEQSGAMKNIKFIDDL